MKNYLDKLSYRFNLQRISILMFFVIGCLSYMDAQLVVPFAKTPDQIFSVKGDYTMFGNTNLIRMPYADVGQNGNSDMVYVDIDNDDDTWNSSSSDFNFAVEDGVNENCTQILYAALYWTGRANNGGTAGNTVDATRTFQGQTQNRTFTKNEIKLKYGTDSYQNITGSFIANPPTDYYQIYSCYADVTDYVKSKGSGTYTVADMALVQGNADGVGYFGCWAMVVVYQNSKMKTKNIAIFQGHAFNSTNNIVDIPIVGFQAVQSGDVNVKLGFLAGEGDRELRGDYAKIQELNTGNFKSLSHSSNSTNNFFNSSINTGGNNRNPTYLNNYGIDVAMFYLDNGNDNDPNTPAVNNVIGNGQTSTIIRVGTTSDIYTMSVLVFGVDAYQPETDEVIKLTAIDGAPPTVPYTCTPGQELTYCVNIKNVGTEPLKNYKLSVPIPSNADFVPGSVSVTLDPLVGTTNAPEPVYNATTRSLEWDFGNLPLPADPATILATFCFKLKATTNCLLLNNSCGQDIPVTGYANGTGVVTNTNIVNQAFILGYIESGECSHEKINGILMTHIDGTDYSMANCDQNYQDGVLDMEIVQNPNGFPVANISPLFPPGTKFFNDDNGAPGTTEYNDSNPFPAVDGTVETYWAVPPGSNACPIKIVLTCVNNCSFSVVCGNQPSGNYNCNTPIPAASTTLAQFNSKFGASQGQNPCHPIKMKVIEDSDFDPCTSIQYDRTYRIYQDDNENGQYDNGEPKVDCIKSYIWLRDQTKPHYSCDPDVPVLVGCRTNGPTAQDAIDAADYSDNCTPTNQLTIVATPLDITSTTSCAKIQNWKVEATDACGNYASVIVQVKWSTDTEAPVFADGSTKTINLGCNPSAPTKSKAISDAGSASDNCGTPTMDATGGSVTGSCNKSQTWTVKAKDACGNIATRTIIYNWKSDTKKPTFSNCQSGQLIVIPGTNPPTAADAIAQVGTISDNCTAYEDLIITASGGNIDSQGDGCNNSQSWTVTATDECGNKQTCVFILAWGSDPIPPTIGNCPSSKIDLGCNPTPPTTDDAIAAVGPINDNSGSVTVTATAGAITGDCTKNQEFVVTATDGCGNSTSCTVKYKWTSDTQGPVFADTTPPEGVELGCLGQGGASQPDAIEAAGEVTDNCTSGNNIIVTAVGGPITGECHKTQDWTVTAKDGCGNTTTKVVTLKWSFDDQNPVFENCPTEPIDLGCNPVNLPQPAWIQDLVNILPDNCGQVDKVITAGPITGTCNKQQIFTVTATDNCNNVATCSVTYTWKDDLVPPTFSSCPTVPIILAQGVEPNEEMAITAVGVISDNCTNNPTVTTTYEEQQGPCGTIKIYHVTATDECGNSNTCTVRYTNSGNSQPPVFENSIPFNDLGCNPANNELPTTDMAIQSAGTATDPDGYILSVTATAGQIMGTCIKSQVFTVQATDDCGNVTTIYITYTWKDDTQNPVFVNCPTAPISVPDITQVTDQLALESAGTPTDNCGVKTITTSHTQIEGPCGPTVVYTVTATDTCGNSADCVVYFKTNDGSQPPVFENCPSEPFNLGCNPETMPTEGSVAEGAGNVSDDGEIVSVVVTAGEVTGDDCNKTQTYIVTATDDCGNQSNCFMTYIWSIDTIKPTFPDVPRTEVDLGCNPVSLPDNTLVLTSLGQVSDNCAIDTIIVTPDEVSGDDCAKSQKWYIKAIDNCGNEADTFITFIWRVDLVPPTITCPVYNGSTQCSDDAPPAYSTLGEFLEAGGTVSDNCTSGELLIFTKLSDQVSGDCGTGIHITRIYQVEDECGNKATCSQIINIVDNTPPVITAGPETPLNFTCASEVPEPNTEGIVATDNCSNVTVTYVGDVVSNQTCVNKFTITRTYRATDECGNYSDYIQIINVNDNVPPIIITPPPISGIQCGGEVPEPYATADDFIAAGGVLSDNCQGELDIISLTFVSETTAPGNCPNSFIVTRTYKATDACGNSATATQTIDVSDTTPPAITVPDPVLVSCASDVPAPDINLVLVSDNCSSNEGITITFVSDEIVNQLCANKYTINRTYKATDECGNYATGTQIITVNDVVPPLIVCPPDISGLQCSSDVPAPYANLSQFIAAGGQASDNCGGGAVVITLINESIVPGNCANQYVLTRTYQAMDVCGNTSSAVQQITVFDNTPPQITVPGPLTVSCAEEVPTADINQVITSDNCSGNVTVTVAQDVISDVVCANKYIINRTYTATDECGNAASGTQTITVNDVTPPVIVVPADLNLVCASDVPAADINLVSATDNCIGDVTITFVGDEIVNQQCANQYVIHRTYKATDVCGNFSTGVQVITVNDNVPPVITCPNDLLFSCAADVPAPNTSLVQATDNCEGEVTITFVSDEIVQQTCANQFELHRTYMATDVCGNSSTCTQIISVADLIPPTIECPAPLNLICASEVPIPDVNSVVASDNCEGEVTVEWVSDVISDQTCENRFVLTRTYKATDVCGNSSTCTQTITVFDDVPPVIHINDPEFADVPNGGTITLQCYAMNPDWTLPTLTSDEISVTDNCGAAIISMNQTVSEGDCMNNGYFKKIHVEITAQDVCENVSNFTFDILIVDEIPPVFTVIPQDATVSCDKASTVTYEVKAEDECECANISFADVIVPGSCAGSYTILRTYTAKDCCGNASTYTQKINVVDNTAPEIIPLDGNLAAYSSGDTIVTYCGDNEYPEWLNKPVNELIKGVDACSGNTTIDLQVNEENQDACWLYGYSKQYNVVFSATDDCGNRKELQLYVQVQDTTAPQVMYIDEFVCEDDNTWPVAFDNCSTLTYDSNDTPVTGECNGSQNYIRTWTIRDACKNTTYATQYVVHNDHKAPIIHMINPDYAGHLTGDIITLECADWKNISKEEALTWVEAEDKCDYITLDFNSREIDGNCLTDGYKTMYEFTWTAADYCGNQSTYVLFFQLSDNTPPVFNTTQNIVNVDCENSIPQVKATDNCSNVKLTVERTKFELGCPNNFSLEEKYTATDACGNTSTFTRTVNVVDTTGPVIYVPDAICETDLGQSNAIAVDYCTNKPAQVTATVDHNVVNCNGSSYYTITYTAADYCGNVTTKVQKVIVEDNTPPVLSFSYDFQSQFNIVDNTIYTGCDNFDDFVDMIDNSDAVVASDECGNVITPTFSEQDGETTCQGDYVTKEHFFKWTATDPCGNTSELNLKVVLEALEQFDFSFIGNDTTVYCNQVVPIPTVLPELNCTQVDLSSTINYGQTAPDGSYTEERTYTYTNLCGEEVNHTQIINHSFQTNMSCNIVIPTEVLCNSSNNLFTVNVTGGTAPYTYYWEILNGWCHIIGGQNTPTVQISISFKTLHLKVTVTDANGCTTTCYVDVDCTLDNPGINDGNTEPVDVDILKPIGQLNTISDISLRPNPTSSQVYLEFESALSEGVVVNISDQFGKVVLSRKLTSTKGFNSQLFETNTLTAGLYQVSLISSDKIKTLQLIKVK